MIANKAKIRGYGCGPALAPTTHLIGEAQPQAIGAVACYASSMHGIRNPHRADLLIQAFICINRAKSVFETSEYLTESDIQAAIMTGHLFKTIHDEIAKTLDAGFRARDRMNPFYNP